MKYTDIWGTAVVIYLEYFKLRYWLNLENDPFSFSVFQVSRLEQTWMTLRQRHTEGAVLYEKTLRPFMKSLNEGRGAGPPCFKVQ